MPSHPLRTGTGFRVSSWRFRGDRPRSLRSAAGVGPLPLLTSDLPAAAVSDRCLGSARQMVTKMGILEFGTTLKIVFLAIVSLKFQGLEWFLILFLIFPPFHLLRQKEFPVVLLQVRLIFQFLQYSAQTLTQYLHLALTA